MEFLYTPDACPSWHARPKAEIHLMPKYKWTEATKANRQQLPEFTFMLHYAFFIIKTSNVNTGSKNKLERNYMQLIRQSERQTYHVANDLEVCNGHSKSRTLGPTELKTYIAVSEMWWLKGQNGPLFTSPFHLTPANHFQFLNEPHLAKTKVLGSSVSKDLVIFDRVVLTE